MLPLLEKIGIINFKYEKLNVRDRFNIFSILRNKSDEVNLHSRFIGELLDKNGTHGQGEVFARIFLNTIGINNFQLGNYQVLREYENIDLLLSNDTHAIIIENKIWAGDQDKQLERYYEKIRSEGYQEILVFYLTIWGTEPSENSVGKLKGRTDIGLLSYSYHIEKWIEGCIEASSRFPVLRETLVQYQNLINELTGKSMGQQQKEEILELLSKDDNILKAHSIAENWIHVRWHTEWDFWNDLESIISQEYRVLDYQKYSPDYLNSVIHQRRNRDRYYGIMFEIGKHKNESVCIYIERGWSEVYYGLTVQRNGDRSVTNNYEFAELGDKVGVFCDWKKENYWLGGKHFQPHINFERFSDENTLRLLNADYRKGIIEDNWNKVREFIENCMSKL